jgi:flagellar biosynthesis/type III secretory pathway protein FliH
MAARVRAAVEPSALRLAGRLATKMAEKIVGRAIDLAPGLMAELAEQALVASRARAGVIRLRIHPDDRALLAGDEARGRLLARLEAGAELELRDDPAVGRHGCVVETATLRLDARLDTQLAALERALAAEGGRD